MTNIQSPARRVNKHPMEGHLITMPMTRGRIRVVSKTNKSCVVERTIHTPGGQWIGSSATLHVPAAAVLDWVLDSTGPMIQNHPILGTLSAADRDYLLSGLYA